MTNKAFSKSAALAATLVLTCALAAPAGVVVSDFDDIVLWTGTGANRAALVIDWGDGKNPLVWGYRFDAATGADMVRDVTEAQEDLYAKVQDFGGSLGWFVHGFGYDRNGAGFAITTGTNFGPDGLVFSALTDDAMAVDASDSYRETDTFFANTWGYWVGSGFSYPGAGWSAASTGISGRNLTNDSWDGFQFNTLGFGNGIPPGTAFAAVPEPSSIVLFSLLAMACTGIRRRA